MSRAWPVEELSGEASLEKNARRILAVRIAEFYSYAPIVDDETATEALHNLRIAAKRLRYTLELFRVVFADSGERLIEQVKAIQEELGNLHDSDVRIALIQDELTTVSAELTAETGRKLAHAKPESYEAILATILRPPPDDPRRGLVALLGREFRNRKRHYDAFYALWTQNAAAGMRQNLVALSTKTSPIIESVTAPIPAG